MVRSRGGAKWGFLTVSQKHKPREQVSVTSVLQLCSQKCRQQATKPEHMAPNLNRSTKWTLDAQLSTLLLKEAVPGPKGLLVLTPHPHLSDHLHGNSPSECFFSTCSRQVLRSIMF